MSKIFEKIVLTFILILGLNIFNGAQAKENFYFQDNEFRVCPINGQVFLHLQGTLQNGQLIGTIDNQFVSWPVLLGTINGFYNGSYMRLNLAPMRFNEFSVSGWVGTYYINWRSYVGNINEYVRCN
jgi:hypothetical protein